MSKIYSTISIFILLISYCLALSISNNIDHSSAFSSDNFPVKKQTYYLTNAKLNLLSLALKNEKLSSNLSKLPNSSGKNKFHDYLNDSKLCESNFKNTYSNYISIEEFSFKFFTSTDIIYPFHYFW